MTHSPLRMIKKHSVLHHDSIASWGDLQVGPWMTTLKLQQRANALIDTVDSPIGDFLPQIEEDLLLCDLDTYEGIRDAQFCIYKRVKAHGMVPATEAKWRDDIYPRLREFFTIFFSDAGRDLRSDDEKKKTWIAHYNTLVRIYLLSMSLKRYLVNLARVMPSSSILPIAHVPDELLQFGAELKHYGLDYRIGQFHQIAMEYDQMLKTSMIFNEGMIDYDE